MVIPRSVAGQEIAYFIAVFFEVQNSNRHSRMVPAV